MIQPKVANRILGRAMIDVVKRKTKEGDKERLMKRIENLNLSIDLELNHAKNGAIFSVIFVAITIISGVGAAVLSDPWGFATTLIAGTAGSGGVASTFFDSWKSYSELKTNLKQKVNQIKDKVESCKENDKKCLDACDKMIDDLFQKLTENST